MKIAGRGGHTKTSGGASFIINEVSADRLVYNAVEKYLKLGGATVINVTPSDSMRYPSELNYGISKANTNNVDLFFSIHFNKCYDKEVSEPIGTEVWVYDKPFPEAQRVVNNLSSLGFKNRGIKSMKQQNRNLAELKNTRMKSMIIEVCFVESRADYNIFKSKGYDLIGKKIAEGILGKSITTPSKKYKVICTGMSEARAKEACDILRKHGNFKCNYEEM